MNPLTIIMAMNAALALAEALVPLMEKLKTDGAISPEQQKELLDRYNSLKNRAEGQFSGAEWTITT